MAKKGFIFRHLRHKQSARHTKLKMGLNQRCHESYRSGWLCLQQVNRSLNLPYSHPFYILSLFIGFLSVVWASFLLSPILYLSILYLYFFTLTENGWGKKKIFSSLFHWLFSLLFYCLSKYLWQCCDASCPTSYKSKVIQANRRHEPCMQSPSLSDVHVWIYFLDALKKKPIKKRKYGSFIHKFFMLILKCSTDLPSMLFEMLVSVCHSVCTELQLPKQNKHFNKMDTLTMIFCIFRANIRYTDV